jgi:hypothetical protein
VNEKVHPAETIGEVFAFLPDKRKLPVMRGEQVGLDKHAA